MSDLDAHRPRRDATLPPSARRGRLRPPQHGPVAAERERPVATAVRDLAGADARYPRPRAGLRHRAGDSPPVRGRCRGGRRRPGTGDAGCRSPPRAAGRVRHWQRELDRDRRGVRSRGARVHPPRARTRGPRRRAPAVSERAGAGGFDRHPRGACPAGRIGGRVWASVVGVIEPPVAHDVLGHGLDDASRPPAWPSAPISGWPAVGRGSSAPRADVAGRRLRSRRAASRGRSRRAGSGTRSRVGPARRGCRR